MKRGETIDIIMFHCNNEIITTLFQEGMDANKEKDEKLRQKIIRLSFHFF